MLTGQVRSCGPTQAPVDFERGPGRAGWGGAGWGGALVRIAGRAGPAQGVNQRLPPSHCCTASGRYRPRHEASPPALRAAAAAGDSPRPGPMACSRYASFCPLSVRLSVAVRPPADAPPGWASDYLSVGPSVPVLGAVGRNWRYRGHRVGMGIWAVPTINQLGAGSCLGGR